MIGVAVPTPSQPSCLLCCRWVEARRENSMTRERSLPALMIFGASVGGVMTSSAYAGGDAELALRLTNPHRLAY